jgi:uncharacterized protein YbjT (DUF2867 family)
MDPVRVLLIGGSGIISSACSGLAIERGMGLYVLNRGRSTDRPLPAQATVLQADIRDPESVDVALGDLDFDAVVNWVAFTPEHVQPFTPLLADAVGSARRSPGDRWFVDETRHVHPAGLRL